MGDSRPRPLIGLTTYRQTARWGAWDRDAAFVPGTYLDVVVRAGGQPVLIPPGRDVDSEAAQDVAGLCEVLDGLVLIGGGDVSPDRYGQVHDPRTTGTSAGRDRLELELLRRAIDSGLPVLAVCRGLQLLNVALGGDLVQHLPDRVGSDAHQPQPGDFGPITVTTEPNSHVRRLCGERIDVLCSHHQAIDRLGTGLWVTGRSDDGIAEAAELDGGAFVVGVQWHPEEPGDVRLFEGLVVAASERDVAGVRSGSTQ
jgi:anthranilate synthase component 2/putative glutamine amidotransferase